VTANRRQDRSGKRINRLKQGSRAAFRRSGSVSRSKTRARLELERVDLTLRRISHLKYRSVLNAALLRPRGRTNRSGSALRYLHAAARTALTLMQVRAHPYVMHRSSKRGVGDPTGDFRCWRTADSQQRNVNHARFSIAKAIVLNEPLMAFPQK
jgi:hypothetical protein